MGRREFLAKHEGWELTAIQALYALRAQEADEQREEVEKSRGEPAPKSRRGMSKVELMDVEGEA
ncbi:MAG: hypothetical protein Q8R92_17575 [Deltaproteobacteria bacterium]|nr:hypothetical protein [Deltaproteobacteria bacterium]